MCESETKFESKRPGTLSDRRDSRPRAQYFYTINILNTETGGRFLSADGNKSFSGHREYRDITVNSECRLRKETLLSNNAFFSNISNSIKTAIAAIFKRNKTQSNVVDTVYRIAFFQLL